MRFGVSKQALCYDYERLEALLFAVNTPFEPAYLHGVMTSILCFSEPKQNKSDLWQQIVSILPCDEENHPELLKLFSELFSGTMAQLQAPDNGSLNLVLPQDELSLSERLSALAQWCEGFLAGIQLCRIQPEQLLKNESVKEVLSDLLHIQDIEFEEPDSEENEKNIFEIIEFIKIGVLLIHAEKSNMHCLNESSETNNIH